MRNSKREVECLRRLQELSPVFEELKAFLGQEYLLSKEELRIIGVALDQARLLQVKLASLSDERKIQLLEYEWTLLPVERIRLTLVTATGFKEFLAEV